MQFRFKKHYIIKIDEIKKKLKIKKKNQYKI
jgi:hypothetical protein